VAKNNQQASQAKESVDDPLLRVSEVAALYDVRPNTVYLWIQTKALPCVRTPGNGIRVRRSHVAAIVGVATSTT
jgi:excisionase family DNA binding protein